jgi:hypothetical protein
MSNLAFRFVPFGQARYHGEVATEDIFSNCDNLINVLGSTNWKSHFGEPVANKLPQHVPPARLQNAKLNSGRRILPQKRSVSVRQATTLRRDILRFNAKGTFG